MKIAISVIGKDMDSLLDPRFGRCDYFQIYDTESKKNNAVANKGQTSGGGAGIAAAQQLIDEKVDVVITGSLGPNAFNLINKAEIKAYKCENIPAKSVLEKYERDELTEIEESGPAHHGTGQRGGR